MSKKTSDRGPEQIGGQGGEPLLSGISTADLLEIMIRRDQTMWDRLTERDAVLQGQITHLVGRMIDSAGHDDVLINGFNAIAEQIGAQTAPLRALGRDRIRLPETQDYALTLLQTALKRQDFSLADDQFDQLGPTQAEINRSHAS